MKVGSCEAEQEPKTDLEIKKEEPSKHLSRPNESLKRQLSDGSEDTEEDKCEEKSKKSSNDK